MFDARQLLTLTQVARTGSYTAAASALGYTQPAVSYQMRQLERAAGTPLVVHADRTIRLTEAGRRLAGHADVVLAALSAAEADIAALNADTGTVIRLAAFQSSCSTLVPVMLDLLAGQGTPTKVVVQQLEPAEATPLVVRNEVDLAVMCDWTNEAASPDERKLRRISLMSDRRCVLLPRGHPLADQPEIDFADLSQESWVMESVRDRFTAACEAAGFEPRIAVTASDIVAIQNLVAVGVGITLMNELAIATHLDPRLKAVPLMNWPRRRIYISMSVRRAQSTAVEAVVTALRGAAQHVQAQLVARSASASQ
ncbi:LysR family transcriptional regulator [Micromonospora sp. NPDC005174]|uniref:LysR family transcriptional regulator n=1 Tax=unclassified Micromonospora TaxID=2617518 RepID=UPI0033B24F3F